MEKIAFIGAGSIAEAIIKGVIHNKLIPADHIWVTNAQNWLRLKELHTKYGVQPISLDNLNLCLEVVDTIVLAFKPKDVLTGLERLKQYKLEGKRVVSVIAGVPTALIETILDVPNLSVIRAMPNTSCAVGESATAVTRGSFVSDADLNAVIDLFEAVGIVEEVPEQDMDAITGLSGSGPAYVYYMIEALVEAGVKVGLERETVKRLVYQTVVGAARMLQEADEEPAVLRKHITSPAGTTAAGIAVLSERGFPEAVIEAVCKATDRAHELGLVHQQSMNS
jgi:pyrroline-5-carboxylate reductase